MSINSSASLSSTAVSEESFYGQRACTGIKTLPIQSIMPTTSKILPSGSFPPRRPIQRSLFVSEEDLIPIDFAGRAESLSPIFPNPITVFHEATGYAYMPTPIHPALESPISTPNIPSLSPSQAPQLLEAGASRCPFPLTFTSILENTIHILCRSVVAQGSRFIWCSGPRKKGRAPFLNLNLSERKTDAKKYPELQAQIPGPSNPLCRLYSPFSDSDSEEEEEIEALLRYGVYPPSCQSAYSSSGSADELPYFCTDCTDCQIGSFPTNINHSVDSPAAKASFSAGSADWSSQAVPWNDLSVSPHPREQLPYEESTRPACTRRTVAAALCRSGSIEYARSGFQH
ncbi:hypothetical protein BT96DRAFT_1017662 [Gymnopus androsaceus JB14]|uniref:Uncharacterized protein n=1 Tax=Gymnopus androsaceus JB14 TaxID=1447944 RepID=A0A6A4HZQ7_9AGAR|nr:hypothetical protein BT96DRAFT_1017662 [Gymnopus androsaceus JB14]